MSRIDDFEPKRRYRIKFNDPYSDTEREIQAEYVGPASIAWEGREPSIPVQEPSTPEFYVFVDDDERLLPVREVIDAELL